MSYVKYGNKSALCSSNHSHRSQLESAVCEIIKLRERAGEIKLLQVEDTILISGWYKYIPDFKCLNMKDNTELWVEAKGFEDARWPSTKKGWRFAGPGPLEIWKGTARSPFLAETIIPKNRFFHE